MTPSRRDLFRTGAAGLGAVALGTTATASGEQIAERSFHYDHVLGTSLDGWVIAPASSADSAERAAVEEIERLRKVFSLHDPESELSRLNRATGGFEVSADLLAVLTEYDRWCDRSGGACNAQVGGLTWAWDRANGTEPDAAALDRAVRRITSSGWTIDGQTVTRRTDQPLNLNSIAKGYILHRAAEMMRRVAGVTAGLLNLGGDMAVWGNVEWTVGVQHPFAPADNAPPFNLARLRNESIATSGGYLRNYSVGGQKRSHILDPRTGRPADGVASATVIAPDSVTANVLATTLCVLTPADGLRLAQSVGAAALVIDADGQEFRSPTFPRYELPVPAVEPKPEFTKADPPKGEAWPEGYEVTLALELPNPGGRARRPYVAFWIEDDAGKAVRTVAVWGNNPKWLGTMSAWWKVARNDRALWKAVCRATRGPGKYELVWDGKDDAGNALPQGTYTIKLEVHREHGKDVLQTGKLECGSKDAKITMEKNAETGESTVTYAKTEKKKDK